MKRDKAKFYRFAFYGRSDSGKTCVLATMAMGAVGHPRRLACERLPVVLPKPGDSNPTGNEEAAALHVGKEWIDEAVDALQHRKRNRGNPPRFDGVPATIDFQIDAPDRGSFLVRTIDYAGELIHPEEEHRPDSMANALKKCLAEYDGFLILVATPGPGDDFHALEDDLRRLREAFSSLHEAKDNAISTPVAIVFTKWDRRSQVNYDSPDEEFGKSQDFLVENAAYRSLVDAVSNALVGQTASPSNVPIGLFCGNCGVFPATAFGRAEMIDGYEVPAASGQRPFGILEPFVWLADRRDFLDATDLEQRWGQLRWWSWLPWNLRQNSRIAREARRRLKRTPLQSASAIRIHRACSSARRAFWCLLIFWSFVACLVADLAYEGVRTRQFWNHVARAEDPRTEEAELGIHRQWFERYALWWNGCFLAPSKSDAEPWIGKIDATVEYRYWSRVDSATDRGIKVDAANQYLKTLPNGPHARECHAILDEHQAFLANQKNADFLNTTEQEYKRARDDDSLGSLLSSLNAGFPEPHFASAPQQDQLRQIKDEAGKRHAEFLAEKDWQVFVTAYREALGARDAVSAASKLSKRMPRDQNWEQVVGDFPGEVQQLVQRKTDELVKDHLFTDAREAVNDGLRSLKDLESVLRSGHPDLAELLLNGQRQMQPQVDHVARLYDQYLYEKLRTIRGKGACTEYLLDGPVGAMKDAVKNYQNYMEQIDKELTVTVGLKIKWDKDYASKYGVHNRVTVKMDDIVVLQPEGFVEPTSGTLSGQIGTFLIVKKRLTEAVKIEVTIIERDWFGDDDGGQNKFTVKIDQLIKGKTIPLTPKDGSPLENEARFEIVAGLPSEPELPAWTSQ